MAKAKQAARVAASGRAAPARRRVQRRRASPVARRPSEEPEHQLSGTAVAAEALRTGVLLGAIRRSRQDQAIPGEARTIQVGDPDDETLGNEYVGDDIPGGSTPTPDQSNVDEIGRAYGLQEEDSGGLRTSSEIVDGRDKRRRGADYTRRRD